MLGSIGRYLTAFAMSRLIPVSFPYGTLAANLLGCLAIGVVYGLSERGGWMTTEWRLFLATGMCGGYTTFSAFAVENIKFLGDGDYAAFAGYSVLSFAGGLFAAYVGLVLAKP